MATTKRKKCMVKNVKPGMVITWEVPGMGGVHTHVFLVTHNVPLDRRQHSGVERTRRALTGDLLGKYPKIGWSCWLDGTKYVTIKKEN